MDENNKINVESRYDKIKQLLLNDFRNDPTILNIDGLLDAFLVLNDECSKATLREDKPIKEFLKNSYFSFLFC